MKPVKGQVIACDFCHQGIFLQYTKTTEHDGGYTQVDHYEPEPEGWKSICFDRQWYKLCPNCYNMAADAINHIIQQVPKQENVNLYRMIFREDDESNE